VAIRAHAELASVVGVVDPVVDAPEQPVRAVLRIALGIAVVGANEFACVSAKVARGVAREPEVGRGRYEHAVLQHLHRTRQHEAVHEDRGLVHPAVMIRVLEHHDASCGTIFSRTLQVGHVAPHFHDVHASVGVEVDGDRVLHQRLRGDELQSVAIHRMKTRALLFGRIHRRHQLFLRFRVGCYGRWPCTHVRDPRRALLCHARSARDLRAGGVYTYRRQWRGIVSTSRNQREGKER